MKLRQLLSPMLRKFKVLGVKTVNPFEQKK